jgi:hypothetical protein
MFIRDSNYNLLRYCEADRIPYTRTPPYNKHDQCHVEQKNWSVVRQMIGYQRMEGAEARQKLSGIYQSLLLYVNFFQPSLKLKSKEREGARGSKTYDQARTPYQRLLAFEEERPEPAQRVLELEPLYLSLNPRALLRQIEAAQDVLWELAREQERLPRSLSGAGSCVT